MARTRTPAPEPQATRGHVAVDPVLHDGVRYEPGQVIPDLTEPQAVELLGYGAITKAPAADP